MGTSSTPGQLAAKMEAAALGVLDGAREGVREAAIVGKAIFEAELPARRLSRVGRRGAKVGARFENPTSMKNPQAILKYVGPVHWLNSGTSKHLIGPKGWRRGRASGRLKFTGGDGEIRAGVVEHPGTDGREFFPGAVKKVAAAAPKQIKAAQHRALLKVFG